MLYKSHVGSAVLTFIKVRCFIQKYTEVLGVLHHLLATLESELPYNKSRDQHSVGGHPREVRWPVIPSEGKNSNSSDSRKTFIILMF